MKIATISILNIEDGSCSWFLRTISENIGLHGKIKQKHQTINCHEEVYLNLVPSWEIIVFNKKFVDVEFFVFFLFFAKG